MFTSIYTDQGIVRRVLRGNTEAFGILLDRYGHIVYGVAYARTGNAADAEEITQDTFVRLYQWLDRIAGRSSVGPWLVEVARNAATDLLRQRHRETTMPTAPAEQAVAVPDSRDAIGIVTPTGASWYPETGVNGATVETSVTGTFQLDPVLPGEYELQVYAKSSPAGYPAATANASVREGETLHTRLVLDTHPFATVEGQVVINGEPTSGVYVRANCEGENMAGTSLGQYR